MATLRPTTPGNAAQRSIGRPPEPARLWSLCLAALAALAALALLATALPSYAARLEPPIQASQAPEAPDAICPAGGQCFADVPAGNSFYEFANRIYMQDLVTGYACGGPGEPCDAQNRPYYRPGGLVTRQQMSKFIDQARRLPGIDIHGSAGRVPISVTNDTDSAIFATSAGGTAVQGGSSTGSGLFGSSTSGYGILGFTSSGSAVVGVTYHASGNYAGYFTGNVEVSGTCCNAGAGTYRIDHPQNPANRFLYHSAVQSSDMKNIYDGIAVLDEQGQAWVQLPGWFEALNKDFRYQLTSIGAPGRDLYIAHEIETNRFEIAGGQAGMKVSWQVTGTRRDPYANAHRTPVEQDKPAGDQGKYIHPTEWGQPVSLGVGYEEQQKMLESMNP